MKKLFLILGLFIFSVCPLQAQQMLTHQSGAGISINSLSSGFKTIYSANQGSFVEAISGEEYEIYIQPPQGLGRCLAVIAVDGINVISGKAATPNDTHGVVIEGQPVTWKGYRHNNNSLTRFKFARAMNSLANVRGLSDSPGVISVSFYSEKSNPQTTTTVTEYRNETRQRTLPNGQVENYTVQVPLTRRLTSRYSTSDMGTTGGTKIDPNLRTVSFTAGRLIGRMYMMYASTAALQNAGLMRPIVPTRPVYPTPTPAVPQTYPEPIRPNPFPGNNPFPEFGG